MQLEEEKVPTLMYNNISRAASLQFRPFTLDPSSFADQMSYLQQHAYTPMTVTQFATLATEGSVLPGRTVVLILDEGCANFYHEALPVLDRNPAIRSGSCYLGVLFGGVRSLMNDLFHFDKKESLKVSAIVWGLAPTTLSYAVGLMAGQSTWHKQFTLSANHHFKEPFRETLHLNN